MALNIAVETKVADAVIEAPGLTFADRMQAETFFENFIVNNAADGWVVINDVNSPHGPVTTRIIVLARVRVNEAPVSFNH